LFKVTWANERQRKTLCFVPKTFVSKTLVYVSVENENGCNKVAIELSGVQLFWSD